MVGHIEILTMEEVVAALDYLRDATKNGEISDFHSFTPGLASCLIEIMFGL
jgi:hypothetical protein